MIYRMKGILSILLSCYPVQKFSFSPLLGGFLKPSALPVVADFNLKPRRNAASVHLMYPIPKAIHVNAFYGEIALGAD